MKKRNLSILLVITLFIGFAAGKALSDSGKDISRIELDSRPIDMLNLDQYTMMQQYKLDYDGDEEEEKVSLYTRAIRIDGEMAWDDGQPWMLVAEDHEGVYVLFDDYVQIGRLDIFAYSEWDSGTVHLLLQETNHTMLRMNDFVFSAEEGIFEKEVVFDSGPIVLENGEMFWHEILLVDLVESEE